MSGHDDDLRALLHGAVDDIEPADRLGEIRRRTATGARPRRHWPLVLIAAGTATAGVVGFAALVGQWVGGTDQPDPAAPGPRQAAVAAYFIDDTVDGPRLFREFQSVPQNDDPAVVAVEALRLLEVDAGALDPDYGTVWSDGSFVAAALDGDRIVVSLDSARPTASDLALQQAVLTAQAAFGTTVSVVFTAPGAEDREVRRDVALLAAVNISDPAEGHEVDELLTVRGIVGPRARDLPEVTWRLVDTATSTDQAVIPTLSGTAPIRGGAWEETTDISAVPSGTYELSVEVVIDGAVHSDTRSLTVR